MQEKGAGHNYKPLVSPEYLCNPPEGNTGVTAHSVLHQDPTTEDIREEQTPRVRNHTEHAKPKVLSSRMNTELE